MNYQVFPGLRRSAQSLFRYNVVGSKAVLNQEKLERVKIAIYHLLDIKWDHVISKTRGGNNGNLVKARYIVSAIMFNPPFVTKSDIGRFLKKDHTTVIYYLYQHENSILTDAEYARTFEAAKSFL